jgi:hypothetical protein
VGTDPPASERIKGSRKAPFSFGLNTVLEEKVCSTDKTNTKKSLCFP